MMRIICIGGRFHRLRVGKWTFAGSVQFLKLVGDAREKLQICDPKIMEEMIDSITVVHLGDQISGAASWGYCIISDAYVAWGGDGILAAWVYFLYQSLEFRRNRWAMADAENSVEADLRARRKAGAWLKEHQFSGKLCRVIGVDE
jgi:hypothetical protein